jgi:hypothetical protein
MIGPAISKNVWGRGLRGRLGSVGTLSFSKCGSYEVRQTFWYLVQPHGLQFQASHRNSENSHGVCLGSDILLAEAQSQNEAAPT